MPCYVLTIKKFVHSRVENQRFNRPKAKKCITEGKINFQKLISGEGGDY
jgi:hypothetical protein